MCVNNSSLRHHQVLIDAIKNPNAKKATPTHVSLKEMNTGSYSEYTYVGPPLLPFNAVFFPLGVTCFFFSLNCLHRATECVKSTLAEEAKKATMLLLPMPIFIKLTTTTILLSLRCAQLISCVVSHTYFFLKKQYFCACMLKTTI